MNSLVFLRQLCVKFAATVLILIGVLLAFEMLQIIPIIIIRLVLSGFYVFDGYDVSQIMSSNSVIVGLYSVSVFLLATMLVYAGRLTQINIIKTIGIQRKPITKDVVQAIIGYCIYSVIGILVTTGISVFLSTVIDTNQQQNLRLAIGSGVSTAILLLIYFVVLVPLFEEIMFRGVMYRLLSRFISFRAAVLIVSLIFGLLHVGFFQGSPLHWLAMIDTFILSIILLYLVKKTDSLWPALFLHVLKNLIAYSLLMHSMYVQ